MCLSIPGKIVEIKSDTAIVDYGHTKREVKLLEIPKLGEYVLVSGGFIVSIVSEREALDFLKTLKQMEEQSVNYCDDE
ncbi:HypC/HybG/HupF family hydrogenase formation chaperone [Candidatus Woesearchaeota archaeon]|jgi:hydrogenase assembly chaperone HypC/HupF|nr:HypC/HybG/HupF family hydrogenase formation chaperone [Candidatus Woesearchaeota archaeon]